MDVDFEPLDLKSSFGGIDFEPIGGPKTHPSVAPKPPDGIDFEPVKPAGPPSLTPETDRALKEVPGGRVVAPNLDINRRPVIQNQDGSISTFRGTTVEQDGVHYVVPGMTDTQPLSLEQSKAQFQNTGQHFGGFASEDEAQAFAKALHEGNAPGQIKPPVRQSFDTDEAYANAMGVFYHFGGKPPPGSIFPELPPGYEPPGIRQMTFAEKLRWRLQEGLSGNVTALLPTMESKAAPPPSEPLIPLDVARFGGGLTMARGGGELLEKVTGLPYGKLAEGMAESTAQQISEMSRPEAIANMVAQIALAPVSLPAFITERMLSLPPQVHHILQTAREKGFLSKEEGEVLAEEIPQDLMAALATLGIGIKGAKYASSIRRAAKMGLRGEGGEVGAQAPFRHTGTPAEAPPGKEPVSPGVWAVAATAAQTSAGPVTERAPSVTDVAARVSQAEGAHTAHFDSDTGTVTVRNPEGEIIGQETLTKDAPNSQIQAAARRAATKFQPPGSPGPELQWVGKEEEAKKPTLAQQALKAEKEAPMTVGAASQEEYMRRYSLMGARHLLDGAKELGDFSARLLREEPSIPKDQLAEIYDRAKQIVNDLRTAGQSKSEMSRFIERELVRRKPTPQTSVKISPMADLKARYRELEKAGKAGYERGVKETEEEWKTRVQDQKTAFGEALRAERAKAKEALTYFKRKIAAADRWMAADQNKLRQDMRDFIATVLPPAERGFFADRVNRLLRRRPATEGARRAMQREAQRLTQAIENRARALWKQNLIDDIEDIHNDILESSGVAVEMRDELAQALKDIRVEGARARRAREKALYLGAGELKYPLTPATAARLERFKAAGRALPDYLREKLADFYRTPMSQLSMEELEALHQELWQMRKVGRDLWSDKQAAIQTEVFNRGRELLTSPSRPMFMFDTFTKEGGQPEWSKAKEGLFNMVKNGLNYALRHEKARLFIEHLFEAFDRERDGWLMRNFAWPMYSADRAYINEFDPVRQKGLEIIKRNNLKPDTDARMIGIHAHAMQGGEDAELLKFTSDKAGLQALIDNYKQNGLTPGQQEFYNYFRGIFDSEIPAMKKFFADNYNKVIRFYENYWPRQVDPAKSAKWFEERSRFKNPVTGEDVDVNNVADSFRAWVDANYYSQRIRKGLAKARLPQAQIPLNLNAFEVAMKHVNDWYYIKHFQPRINIMSRLSGSGLFFEHYGRTGKAFIDDYMTAISQRGQYAKGEIAAAADALRNRAMIGTLGFRLNQFKHLANYPLGMSESGGANWWERGFMASFTEEGKQLIKRLFPDMLEAMGGDPTLKEAADYNRLIQGKGSRQAAFAIDRILDYRNRAATGLGRYFKELDKAGLDWSDWHNIPDQERLANISRAAYTRAVGSPSIISRPLAITRGTTLGHSPTLAKYLFQYQSPKMVRWGVVRNALLEDAIRRGEWTKAAGKIGVVGMGSLMEAGVKFGSKSAYIAAASGILKAMGLEEYKRQYEKSAGEQIINEAIADLVSLPPFVGFPATQYLAAKEYPHSRMQILHKTGISTWDTTVNTFNDVFSFMHDPTNMKHGLQLASDFGMLTGLPISTPVQVARAAIQLHDQKSQQRLDMEQMREQLGLPPGSRIPKGPFQIPVSSRQKNPFKTAP
jgi:hypothetical protein